MATTKITSPELFDLASLDSALQLPSGTTAERPTSPSTGEWRYNTDDNAIEFYDGSFWLTIQDEDIPPVASENFNTVLYDGTSATHAITGLGFQPDLVWIKDRGNAEQHILNDSSRGASNDLSSNTTGAQANRPTGFLSFDSDGFTLGTDGGGVVNDSARGPYVAWCWKANGGTTSSNTDGSITSTVQANTKAGFSIVQWTGTGSAGTLGHGLSSAPELIMVKDTTVAYNWYVFTTATGSNIRFEGLNTDSASTPAASQMTTTSTLIENVPSVASLNTSGSAMIIYAFHSVSGYSKFGSYTGTGLSNGPIINTGFEPAYIMVKGSSNPGSWWIWDNKRNTTNPRNNILRADTNGAEVTNTTYDVNFLSNGFQLIGTNTDVNGSGRTYIYMAFASDPSTAPVLADSFDTTIYDGSGTLRNVSGLGFSPSFAWIKNRVAANSHNLYDTSRGATKLLESDTTDAEATSSTGLTAFLNNGFTVSTGSGVNNASGQYVAWNWKANSIPTINTDGSETTVVSANQAAGFSIVKIGNAGPNTYGHGLTAAPEIIFFKMLNVVSPWYTYNKDLNGGSNPAAWFLKLDSTAAETNNPSGSLFNTTEPTSTVFSLGTSIGNAIAYCFHSVDGFSKIGSYAGNGTSQSVTLGFEPTFLMLRKRDDVQDWFMLDSVRDPSNPKSERLFANLSSGRTVSSTTISFTSTGFDLPSASFNDTGKNFIYMAFKENPEQPAIPSGEMAYLVVAGGGSGHRSDSNNGAGGGGAGGLRSSYVRTGGGGTVESNITLTAKTYTITVGAGGADNSTASGPAISGSDSVLDTITSVGGGGGGGIGLPAEVSTSGGSGGGGGGYNSAAGASGTSNQGFAGGNGSPSTSGTFSERNGGGGGGAGSVGTTGSTSSAGPGGIGVTVPITGTNVGYAGGGSGGNKAGSNVPGTDGGGSGAGTGAIGTAGTANTGGGGGGGGVNSYAGKGGGSGIVILRMNTSDYSGTTTGSPTVTTVGGETILTYTGSGTYVHS